MYFVSACLMGKNCRYNGKTKPCKEVIDFLNNKDYVLICPEQAGKLEIPRLPCEIQGGTGKEVLEGIAQVKDEKDTNRTKNFVDGAMISFAKVEKYSNGKENDLIILKENSPSCGVKNVYDGTFSKNKLEGKGVFAELCTMKGYKIISEEEIGLIK